jgi:hypothetical protein
MKITPAEEFHRGQAMKLQKVYHMGIPVDNLHRAAAGGSNRGSMMEDGGSTGAIIHPPSSILDPVQAAALKRSTKNG